MSENTIYNKALDAYKVPRDVYNAIRKASNTTGVNFSYLMEKAAVESSFDTNAKARTSSATGLYQFIESTWLKMVKDHGHKYGLSNYAAKIDDNGRVSDPKARREILNLRKDPEISSLMAAEFDSANYDRLKESVGGTIGRTELYMAHFMGAGGASNFLNAMKKSPNMVAADLFPAEARSNRNVFYDQRTGQPRSLKQIYAFFDRKFEGEGITTPRNFAAAKTNPEMQQITAAAPSTPSSVTMMDLLPEEDPFARLAALMNPGNTPSLLRLSAAAPSDNWEIFPPSLYNRLSLSPAQMMLLSDFNA